MPGIIVESGLETGTNADILSANRLQTVPSNGMLTFEMQASDNIAANNYTASIQLPDGDTPLNATLVPGTATAGLTGILDERLKMMASFPIAQGGHCVFGCIETGDTEFMWRVTFTPFASR